MLTATRGKHPAVVKDLLERAPEYEFYQAMQLLEANAEDGRSDFSGLARQVRLRPAPEISFPAGDIRRCQLDAQGRLDFELNFSGLYGVDSPLPHFFLDTVAEADEPGLVLRAFLDVFNQRLYQLHYLAWKKFHGHDCQQGSSIYTRYLKVLSGLEAPKQQRSLAYAGLIGSRAKNKQGLVALLEDYLQLPVEVRQYAPCWVRLDQVPRLGEGQGLALGENVLLGDRVLDLSRKVLLEVGPASLPQAKTLLPGQPQAKELGQMVRQYLDPTMEFDLELQIQPGNGAAHQLGQQDVILGWTSWLGDIGRQGNRIHLPGSCF